MAQVKKAMFESRILEIAAHLFRQENYHEISMSKIGKMAGVAPANIYTYYESKFELIQIVFANMIEAQLEDIEEKAQLVEDPRGRIIFVLQRFWIECIGSQGVLSRNFIQALALIDEKNKHFEFKDVLLEHSVKKLGRAMALGKLESRISRKREDEIMLLVVMAFDGFAINSARKFPPKTVESIIDSFADLILA